MKFSTFESILENCLSLYNKANEQDEKLSEAFGSDTVVMTDWWSKYIEDNIAALEKEFNDHGAIEWLFWESMTTKEYLTFEENGIIYIGNPKNIWLDLNGMLDEKYGDVLSDEDSEPSEQSEPSEPSEPSVLSYSEEKEEEYDNDKDSEDNNYSLKLIAFLKMQVEISSKDLLNLPRKMDEFFENSLLDDEISPDNFKQILDKEYPKFEFEAKNKHKLDNIVSNLNAVLSQFIHEPITDNILKNIEFEVLNVFNNLKELNKIFNFKIINASKVPFKENIQCIVKWEWSDLNELKKVMRIDINKEGVKIEIK